MEDNGGEADRAWTPPAWLEERQLPDHRFAQAYEGLGPRRRALLKTLIARHFALDAPSPVLTEQASRQLRLFTHGRATAPAPFALMVCAPGCDAPALLLAALVPALCARVPEVMVVRLGPAREVPEALICACELAGQERLDALGPKQLARLLLELAQSGRPGVVLYPDAPVLRSVLAAKGLGAALDASPLKLVALRQPLRPGLWRDAPGDFSAEDVALLYGDLPFEQAGQDAGASWQDFSAARRDLLLVPAARFAEASSAAAARLVVEASCLGLWRWRELGPMTFLSERQSFGPVPGAPSNQP